MNLKAAAVLLGTILFIFPSVSFAIRCGNGLVDIGDLKHEVLVACGEPKSKEDIGYIDKMIDGDRIRIMKIEEWIVETGGSYYSLIFEGNMLASIEPAGKRR